MITPSGLVLFLAPIIGEYGTLNIKYGLGVFIDLVTLCTCQPSSLIPSISL